VKRLPVLAAPGILLLTLGACALPQLVALQPEPSAPPPSAVPQVVTVVATPTPGGLPPESVEERRIAIYLRAAPAVVNITTQVLRPTFYWNEAPEEGSGSGFVWDVQGHVVTNFHVIQDARRIEVSFGDDLPREAEVVGGDPATDLAVLRVQDAPDGLLPLELGASGSLRVGQTAYAIGNPFGQFERTMTEGIISALNRTIETDQTVLRGVIQTDAAINRGNSGGPLLDSQGRLIGVNTAIFSPTGTSAGVGLAIPVDKVRRVVPALIRDGRYPLPWLGIEGLGYEITPGLRQALRLPAQQGLLIARLYDDSPADRAGLRGAQSEAIIGNRRVLVGGDILTAIDGRPLAKWEDLSAYLEEEAQVGQVVTLTLVRDGETATVQAPLQDLPDSLRVR
jgi:S1-C subfamily serine protease